jgi:hypothetical protein
MAAQVLPMFDARLEEQEDWTARCVALLSRQLEEILKGLSMYKILDISSAIFSRKADILGQMLLALIRVLSARVHRAKKFWESGDFSQQPRGPRGRA